MYNYLLYQGFTFEIVLKLFSDDTYMHNCNLFLKVASPNLIFLVGVAVTKNYNCDEIFLRH